MATEDDVQLEQSAGDTDDPEFDIGVGEDGEPKAEALVYNEDSLNLCDEFSGHPEGDEALKQVGDKVVRDFDIDWGSTEAYREVAAANWKLFAGDLPPKAYPYKDAANVHVPIMLENITRVEMRMFGEIFPDWSSVFNVSSLGQQDDSVSNVLTMHGNWQLRNKIPDFSRQMHRAVLFYLTDGDITIHSYYDPVRKENRHEVLSPDEFVIPYVSKTTMPDYSDVPRRTKILEKHRHEIEAMRDTWFGVDKVLADDDSSWDSDPEQPIAQAVAETTGIEKPDEGEAPRKILWYEGWMMLPNQERLRFVQAIVDYATKHVFQLTIHEEAPWEDKARYERQLGELQQFRQAMGDYSQAMADHQQQIAQIGMATATENIGPENTIAQLDALRAQEPQPPLPPAWMKDPSDPEAAPEQPEKRPINLFTHGVCIEPSAGSLGLGYGRMEADFNRAADTSLSQFTDAATLANCQTKISTENVEWDKDGFVLAPGRINRVTGLSGPELQGNLLDFKFGPPEPSLLEVVDRMSKAGESAIQGPAVLSGESGKSGETARGIAARIEQATKQLSVVARKFVDEVLIRVLKNNAYLNAIFLPDEEIIEMEKNLVVDGMEPSFKVGRKMYERNFQVEVRADLRFTTQAQRVGEADDALKLFQSVPQLQGNIPLWYGLVKRCLTARGLRDLIPLLGPPPPPPMTPFGIPPPAQPPPPGMPGPGGPPGPPPSGAVPPGGPPNGPPPGLPPRPPPQLAGSHQ